MEEQIGSSAVRATRSTAIAGCRRLCPGSSHADVRDPTAFQEKIWCWSISLDLRHGVYAQGQPRASWNALPVPMMVHVL